MTILYRYIGGGALYHVPARDLTEQDLADFAEVWKENGITEETLIKSGLYARAGEVAAAEDELEQRLKDIEEIETPRKRVKAGK